MLKLVGALFVSLTLFAPANFAKSDLEKQRAKEDKEYKKQTHKNGLRGLAKANKQTQKERRKLDKQRKKRSAA